MRYRFIFIGDAGGIFVNYDVGQYLRNPTTPANLRLMLEKIGKVTIGGDRWYQNRYVVADSKLQADEYSVLLDPIVFYELEDENSPGWKASIEEGERRAKGCKDSVD